MVQWNVKTGRRRRIRRGGPRPTVKSLQAQMVEKDAQLKEVQSEKQSVLDENATLKSTVARLELLGVKFVAASCLHILLDLIAEMLCDAEWKGLRKVLSRFSHFWARFDMI